MSSAIVARKPESSGNFVPAPAGLQRAVMCDVIDLGLVESSFTNDKGEKKVAHKIRLVWQSENPHPETGKPLLVMAALTLSLHEKATLRKYIESIIGRPLTKAEEDAGYPVESLIGTTSLLNVVHNTEGENVFANVASIAPLYKGMESLEIRDYVRKKDRPEDGQQKGSAKQGGSSRPARQQAAAVASNGNVDADILAVAREIADRTREHHEDVIYEASKFKGDDDKEFGFRVPGKQSDKWKAGTLNRLKKRLETLSLVAEGPSDEDVPF